MSWAKIDDNLAHHPKFVTAADPPSADWAAAYGLYVAAVGYARKHLTDGFIPRAALPSVLPLAPLPALRRLAARLVEARFFEPDPSGWRIHDFLDWNESAAEVRAGKEAERERLRAWRRNAESYRRTHVSTNGPTNDVRTSAPNNVRTAADPILSDPSSTSPPVVPPAESAVPPWVSSLPWPDLPPAWWNRTLRLFPGLDAEAVLRDAAAYWLDHRGKYRDVRRFIRNQLARAFARRAEPDATASEPADWDCALCGGFHTGTRNQRPTCPQELAAARGGGVERVGGMVARVVGSEGS